VLYHLGVPAAEIDQMAAGAAHRDNGGYQLLNVERRVPEVFGSIYDAREFDQIDRLPARPRETVHPFFAKKWVEKTILGRLLEDYEVI
jgi:oleate hydratase